ncbi:unnamed protein product [Symbiodinium natans]|uniref:Uncharacterized protein n=1 Tax=Symbiodinium natans TaxID=878477 RepID=A0A812IG02_9DINO|nr:unnamed protein product [Symbiodinium natans]
MVFLLNSAPKSRRASHEARIPNQSMSQDQAAAGNERSHSTNTRHDELASVPQEEADNFVHFFHGLAQQQRKPAGGQTVLAQGLQAQASRRAVIFTCSYGDGHKSAQQAVQDFLKAAGFVVEAVDTTHDPRFEDSLHRRLGTRLMDVWYNRMVLRWKMYSIQNMLESVGSLFFGRWNSPCPSPSCNSPTKDAFRSVLLEQRPDIVAARSRWGGEFRAVPGAQKRTKHASLDFDDPR